jgi:hypothetical protein
MTMNRELVKATIDRILHAITLETGDGPGNWRMVQAPHCSLDLETYELLVKRTGRRGYSEFFTRAARALEPIVSFDQIEKVIAAVKKHRSNNRYKTVHTRIRLDEFNWIDTTATVLGVRPSRVLEAVVFLYLRAENQESVGES